jgi:hypothetical protein
MALHLYMEEYYNDLLKKHALNGGDPDEENEAPADDQAQEDDQPAEDNQVQENDQAPEDDQAQGDEQAQGDDQVPEDDQQQVDAAQGSNNKGRVGNQGSNKQQDEDENVYYEGPKIDKTPPSRMSLLEIPAGTLLYHGTKKEIFDPDNIILGNDVLVAFFSTSKQVAVSHVGMCSEYGGVVHMFKVIRNIPRIFVISEYENLNMDPKTMNDKYCNGKNDNHHRYNGVGFFIPPENMKNFSNVDSNNTLVNSEFALCDTDALEYVCTWRCINRRKLGRPYRFNDNKIKIEQNKV